MNQTIVSEMDKITVQTWHRILELRSGVFVNEQQCVYTDPDKYDLGAHHVQVRAGDEVIGYGRFFLHENEWKIGRIVVSENQRKKGVAKTIAQTCIDHILDTNANAQISLSAQVYLSLFYQKLGFVPVRSMYLEDGIPHLKMVYARNTGI